MRCLLRSKEGVESFGARVIITDGLPDAGAELSTISPDPGIISFWLSNDFGGALYLFE